jgi:pantoate--beta-alanine ligase
MSSRNVRLLPEERGQAPVLYRALTAARVAVENGERDAGKLREAICAVIGEAPLAVIDYVEIVDADNLKPVDRVAGSCLIALAAWFGATRLIDNITVRV